MTSKLLPTLCRSVKHATFVRNAAASQRSFVSATLPLLETHKMKVPTMGDSITEGTIIEWTAAIGQAVKEGDVVALVETDKVTIDIKAEMDGVVTQHFVAVEETADVGAELYEIDTEAEATISAPEASSEKPAAAAAPASVPEPVKSPVIAAAAAPEKNQQSHRNPSIHFLGKDGWKIALTPFVPVVHAPLPANYGRPGFSEEEMEALMMGGANLSPEVKQPSGGAIFGW